jgi:hypothetical protein
MYTALRKDGTVSDGLHTPSQFIKFDLIASRSGI